MANDLKENKNKNGIYIRGDVISNSAKIVKNERQYHKGFR